MKKENLFLLILFFLNSSVFISAEITGETITSKATSHEIGLSIFIQAIENFPSINILSPKNNTYLTNESILLNYTLINGDEIWYNLDNLENITLEHPKYINVSQGQHTISFYANNTNGTISKYVSFLVNSSKFIIIFEEYKVTVKGNSTNFKDYTYEEIQNLENIILENTNYGKIKFNSAINLTNDKINLDNILNLDSNTEISQNSINLNSEEIPNFNVPSTIWIYNLGYTNPRILRNGEVCPSNICIKEFYSGGTLKFNVTQFTTYSAEETPDDSEEEEEDEDDDDEGGDYGDYTGEYYDEDYKTEYIREIVISRENLYISTEKIQVSLHQGEETKREFYIQNNDNKTIKIKIDPYGINQFININETEFRLSPGERKPIKISFLVREDTLPGSYIGKIFTITSERIYETPVIIDVQSKGSLFDVILEIDKKSINIHPKETLFFKTKIYNLGVSEKVDISIKYTIKDSAGAIILEEESTEKIESYLEKDGEIKIPKKTKTGRYFLTIKIDYAEKTAIASSDFLVEKRKLNIYFKILIAFSAIIFILIVLWIIGKKEKEKEDEELEKKQHP